MALPIRLLLANGKDEIDLVAQSIDMSVNRNVSAFPTPNNALKRFAVDTNVPAIKVDINGIFADDEGINVDSGNTVTIDSEPMRSAINFGALLPTDRNNLTGRRGGILHPNNRTSSSSWDIIEPNWTPSASVLKGQQNTIPLLARVGSDFEEASDDTAELDVNPSTLFKSTGSFAGVSQITVTHSTTVAYRTIDSVLNVGDRLTKSDGTAIGIVSSVSGNTIDFTTNIAVSLSTNDEIHVSLRVFNHIGEEVGFASYLIDDPAIDDGDTAKYTLGLTDANSAHIHEGQGITINRLPEILERFRDQTIKLIPSYWLENPPVSGLIRDSSMESNISPHGSTNSSGTGNIPRIGVRLQFDLDEPYSTAPYRARVALLGRGSTDAGTYDAIIKVPIGGIDGANNPALEMTKRVKDAFELSGTFVSSLKNGFNPANDKTLASAFKITRTGVVLTIEQVYNPAIETLHPQILSPDLVDLFGSIEFHSSSTTPIQSRKSAGDKAQDLIGLVSNANRNTDLLRGIQIPYDSLVTSTGVTGMARNFFLTFGAVNTADKLSTSNNRSAGAGMSDLLLGMDEGGAGSDDSPDKWYEKILKAITPDEIEAIFGFLVGAAKDALWITVSQRNQASTNDGGIRIIPEKLHVRYDAGNNYYAFNLELLVSDYVMGV